jgi:hypothetical protein
MYNNIMKIDSKSCIYACKLTGYVLTSPIIGTARIIYSLASLIFNTCAAAYNRYQASKLYLAVKGYEKNNPTLLPQKGASDAVRIKAAKGSDYEETDTSETPPLPEAYQKLVNSQYDYANFSRAYTRLGALDRRQLLKGVIELIPIAGPVYLTLRPLPRP